VVIQAQSVPPSTSSGSLDIKDYPGFETVFVETRDQLIRQLGRMDALDNKTGIIAGFDGLIVTAAVGVLPDLLSSFPPSGIWQSWVYRMPVAVLTIGVVAVFVSFLLAIKAYRVRRYSEMINPRAAYNKWLNMSESETRFQLLHNMIEANEQNESALDNKAEDVKKSTWALLIGVTLFSTAAIMFVMTKIA